MTKQDVTYKGIELVGIAGDARADYLIAIKKASEGKFDEARKLVATASDTLTQAHIAQTEMLQEEAKENYSDVTLLMVHGQDHLMTTVLLRDLVNTIIDLYERIGKK
ncbi:PTS lactose/cellobiose transporter subunit IIA [Spiroplasma endosymbiont of Labia minor]|uniref:PTS lactose/cellobiose transporter subunit IIA n=1 Tax=Spiroplasma endosymbiont of Labia minor TaxID=3066305 RepID=UPI0030D0CC85